MKKTSRTIINNVLAIFVFASLAAFIDTLLNIVLGGFYTFSFFSTLNFFAQNVIINFAATTLIAILFFLIFYSVSKILPAAKKLSVNNAVLSAVFASLFFILVFTPINLLILKKIFALSSIIVNSALIVASLIFSIVSYFFLKKLIKIVSSRFLLTTGISIAIISLLTAIAGMLLGPYGQPEPPGPNMPNVLLISIDALRQDHLSIYSDDYVDTPNIDNIAKRAVVFENAYTNNPWTIPSVYTMLSSRYPSVHRADYTYEGDPNMPMLAEILAANGYDTEAYVSNPLLRGEYGFGQGFYKYAWVNDISPLLSFKATSVYRFFLRIKLTFFHPEPGDDTTQWITSSLINTLDRKRNRPFFIWAHYFDPHGPLNPPLEYLKYDDSEQQRLLEVGHWTSIRDIGFDPEYQKDVFTLYQAETKYVDDSLAQVFDIIEKRGYYENTVIIITSDHGEEIYEHGRYGHGFTHYRENMDIPLIIYFPDHKPEKSVLPAALIDVAPTILEYANLPVDGVLSGKSLLDDSVSISDGDIFFDRTSDDHSTKSIRRGDFTLTRTGEEQYEYRLIDNRIERGPNDDVTDEFPELVEEYGIILNEWTELIKEEVKEVGTDRKSMLDDEQLKNLKDFGYVN